MTFLITGAHFRSRLIFPREPCASAAKDFLLNGFLGGVSGNELRKEWREHANGMDGKGWRIMGANCGPVGMGRLPEAEERAILVKIDGIFPGARGIFPWDDRGQYPGLKCFTTPAICGESLRLRAV